MWVTRVITTYYTLIAACLLQAVTGYISLMQHFISIYTELLMLDSSMLTLQVYESAIHCLLPYENVLTDIKRTFIK
jgi:hypothetical protein